MDSKTLVNTFFDLVKIDSPSRFEADVATYCEKYLTELGFSVSYDDSQLATGSNTGNLIAHIEGTYPGHIMLSAHMDCVEPCKGVIPVIEEGIIRSAGETVLGADDKAGVAAILEAVRSVTTSGNPFPGITVLFTTCEEMSLEGAAELPTELFFDNAPCFVFDADGEPGTIILGAPFHYTFEATFSGKAAHAGVAPEEGASAIRMAARAIEAMNLGRIDEHTTANVGIIEGGREINIVPDSCVLHGECRSLYDERAEKNCSQISKACEEAASEFGGKVDITWTLDYPGVLYQEDEPLVKFLEQRAQIAGLEPQFAFSGGGADTNVIYAKGARAITLGVGMKGFHSFDESISLKDLEGAARFCEAILTPDATSL